ncbi:MAG: 2-hydroxyacyl-CoA dehydratase [Clostridia bacterium]|nr:2-hydroxyacyl-CoA dehydratase [Clostridia bacterium]
MAEKQYIEFTEEMKKEYKILVPNMLPVHFELIISVLRTFGFNAELLRSEGPQIAETGLKYVHNDTCYPAVLVIGQFLYAIMSGKYDPHKVALVLFQTGGGCRASNYIPLLRKALERAGYGYVPVISFSPAGIEKHSGFKLTLRHWHAMVYAVLYGDLIMSLANQSKPYELNKGDTDRLSDRLTDKLSKELGKGGKIKYDRIKENYGKIIKLYADIPKNKTQKVKVGVVGEIFVKYSPLGNNNLEKFLIDEGAEVTVPGLLDFCLYSVYNSINDYRLYGRNFISHKLYEIAYKFVCRKKQDIIDLVTEEGSFTPWTPFEHTVSLAKGYISTGTKMGEGWLLTAEMLELAESGVKNIVCTQPFGCLPNHICGKGMMRPIKERNPDVNIVAIDYDAGATKANQENRLRLMLSNARDNIKSTEEEEIISETKRDFAPVP